MNPDAYRMLSSARKPPGGSPISHTWPEPCRPHSSLKAYARFMPAAARVASLSFTRPFKKPGF